MSWSQTSQSGYLYDQMTILCGSAIRLLEGEAGVFVLSNEAFDPQSSSEYTLYRLNASLFPQLITAFQEGAQPTVGRPLVVGALPQSLREGLASGRSEVAEDLDLNRAERCSLLVSDFAGIVGVLHCLRPAGVCSSIEQDHLCQGTHTRDAPQGALRLFIAQLAAGLRSTLESQSLLKEQGRLAAIFQHSTEGILTVDQTLRIIDFNPAMERLTGWRESEVLGRFYYEVLRPKDRQGNDVGLQGSPILQAFAGRSVVNREMMISARDGQRFDVRVTASAVYSARGEPMNGILNVRDISDEREQEEQRSTFISVISHELQTPIAIIKGYASTLARTDAMLNPAVLRSRLQAVEEEADRLNKLVGNLLYASRIQAGGLQMEIVPLELPPLISSVVRRLLAKSPDITISLALPAYLPPVMADRERIEEVLQNLLDNAIKYSPRARTFTVASSATGDEVIVSVSDSGMGISLREQEHIFDRFHRAGDSTTPATTGAGLGLYICRAIIEAHGGRIWVESTLHEGSTFSFSLPRVEKARLPMVVF
jgi:PAS domain S-box-containing protein